ncbi:MAG: MetQ/NlpA family ABC transporter substrate-binding protein [Bacteroidetes bacterium]|nr:MetQ/NlpA family ABC transporter substrate-binding protein [Bacteroidota bacterium]MCL5025870.1 MetQ/NlpA family ABC transporter substrate-binding protein [Chloroflexota bacterium]
MSSLRWIAVLGLVLAVLSGSCAAQSSSAPLKVGLLPIIETLPVWVALQEGYFQAEGLTVEPVMFSSAMERDVALQARQIDGELNDLVSTALLDKDGPTVKVVRQTFKANPDLAMISLLVSPKSDIRSAADLKGKQIALSHNSVIEYVVDELLASNGIQPGDVEKTEVSKIPVRMEMLVQGQVAAAGMPEPLSTLAQKQGARVLLDDRKDGFGQSVWVFRQDVLKDRPDAAKRFLAAYEKAVAAINANPEKYRSLLADKANLPEPLKDSFTVPKMPTAGVPTPAEVDRVVKWMLDKGMLSRPLSYADLVDGGYLPSK